MQNLIFCLRVALRDAPQSKKAIRPLSRRRRTGERFGTVPLYFFSLVFLKIEEVEFEIFQYLWR